MRKKPFFSLFDKNVLVEGHENMGKYQPSYLLKAYDRMIRTGVKCAVEKCETAIKNIETAHNKFMETTSPRRPNQAA